MSKKKTEPGFAARVAARIREARLQSPLTLNELAAAAGMSRMTWHRLESGESLEEFGSKIDAIAAALGVSLESLIKPLGKVKENQDVNSKPTNRGENQDPTGGRGKHPDNGHKNGRAARKTGIRRARAGKDSAGGT